jgi:hypothetical protein
VSRQPYENPAGFGALRASASSNSARRRAHTGRRVAKVISETTQGETEVSNAECEERGGLGAGVRPVQEVRVQA